MDGSGTRLLAAKRSRPAGILYSMARPLRRARPESGAGVLTGIRLGVSSAGGTDTRRTAVSTARADRRGNRARHRGARRASRFQPAARELRDAGPAAHADDRPIAAGVSAA